MRFAALLFGAGFGFVLSRARATDYDAITGMFRLRDFYLMGVMGVAIAVAALGLAVLKRRRQSALLGGPIEVQPKPTQPGLFVAGLVFGTGWAVTGACPGPVMTQLGELKLYALFTAAGIVAGTWVFGARRARAAARPPVAATRPAPARS
jgi:hypothetical protein